MQLTSFIRKVNRITSNSLQTVQSLKHESVELLDIIYIDNLWDIDYGMIKSDWWIVLHDDEHLEERLVSAMVMGSECKEFEVFSFYKIDQNRKVTICPRMFRKDVRIEIDHLYPILPVRMETLLDGWVLEHGI